MFTHYRCTDCLRTSSLPANAKGVMVENCTLTKGCFGALFKFGASNKALPSTYSDGLEDWTADGYVPKVEVAKKPFVSLATSVDGSLTIAVKSSMVGNASTLTLNLERSSVANNTTSTFVFNLLKPSRILFGKDVNNALFRLTPAMVDGRQFVVFINGVEFKGAVQVSTSTVEFQTLYPKGTVIKIVAYTTPPTTVESVSLFRNVVSSSRDSAFNNVDAVKVYSVIGDEAFLTPTGEMYTLFHTRSIDVQAVAMYGVVGVILPSGLNVPLSGCLFCMADIGRGQRGRSVSSVVALSKAGANTLIPLTTDGGRQTLTVDPDAVATAYPPVVYYGNGGLPVNAVL